MDIKFTVQNKVLERLDDVPLVEGTMNYLYASFDFSADWYGMPKTAVFTHGADVEQVVLTDDRCLIPANIIKPESFKVTVYSGNKVITNDFEVNVYTNYPEHPPEPTPDVYEQIITWLYSLDSRLTIVELNVIHGGGVLDLIGLFPTAPAVGADGQYYFNTTENKLYVYAVDRWMENEAMLGANHLYVTPADGTVYYYASPELEPIGGLSDLQFEVVEELPAVGEAGIIYLLPKTDAQSTLAKTARTVEARTANARDTEENVYEEYIWLESGRYELLGTTEIDLSNYYTKDEIENLIKDFVAYKQFEDNGQLRKTIELANHDTISGLDTTGTGHNLAMVSKWDVADFGAKGLHFNINTKDNVTINDQDIVATTADVETAQNELSQEINDAQTSLSQEIDTVDNRLTQEIENIRNGLGIYVTIDGVQEITNKIINADANEISNLRVSNFNSDAVALTISDTPSDAKFVTEQAVKDKFDAERLTAGDNITIQNNVISATPDMYEAGENIEIVGNVISARGLNYTGDGRYINVSGNVISAQNIPEELNDLTDVNLSDIRNGQILVYNTNTNRWENMTNSGGTQYTATGYVHISDENVISVDLSSKQDALTAGSHITITRYSPTGALYIAATPFAMNEISNVSINDIATNQVLVYNGTQWVNETLPEGTPYHAGEDITIDNNNLISVSDGFQNRVTSLEENKQDKLIAGDNITISGNTVSAFAELGAEDIEYNNGEFTTVAEALDSLLYIAPQITSFSGGSQNEIGSTVNEVRLTWGLNKTVTSLKLTRGNLGVVDLEPNTRNYTDSDLNLTSNFTYTLEANDVRTTVRQSTQVQFLQRRYWGVSANDTVTDEEIRTQFSSDFQQSRSQTRNFNLSGGRY